MKSNNLKLCLNFVATLFIFIFGRLNVVSQVPGSLFMETNNFYSQIYNPAYQRSDKAISFSFAGAAGFNFINQGNFKISDLIVLDQQSNPVLDIENFYNNSEETNIIRQNLSIPMAFLSVPLKKGTFSFYYRENFSSLEKVNQEVFGFLLYGNEPEKYRDFNTGELKMNGVGFREFAFGLANTYKPGLDYGIRVKLLFGGAYINTSNWVYGIETDAEAVKVNLSAKGKGGFMVPVPVILNPDNTINTIESDGIVGEYFTEYSNPGIALDFGVNYTKIKNHFFSAAINDLGGILFRRNNFNMTSGGQYDFYGFDLTNAVRYLDPGESGYIDPDDDVELVKDSIQAIYLPIMNEDHKWYGLAPKLMLHYHYNLSENLAFGITNQTAFQTGWISNVFAANAMQRFRGFSIFESMNLHDLTDLTVGGGLQYEGRYAQVFMATDNLIAFYHPAANKTFSVTLGACFLIGKGKDTGDQKKSKGRGNNGKATEYLPFYEERR